MLDPVHFDVNLLSIPVVLIPEEQLLQIIDPPGTAFEGYLSGGTPQS